MADPIFDPSKPYEVVGGSQPQFDPSQPYEVVGHAAAPSVGEDVAKSGGIGLVKGGIGLAGTGGDIREMQAGLLSKGAGALGLDVAPETVSKGLRFIPGM